MRNEISKRTFFVFICLLFSIPTVFGQTAIGKDEVEGKDVILDFKPDDNRGIILSWVTKEDVVTSPVGGTMIFDSADKKVKYYKSGSSPGWFDLSINSGKVDLTIQNEETANYSPTVIGKDAATATGVLILEADNKAMVLPKSESPHLNIKSPAAGTIAYDKESKMLCVFNGEEWSFWKVAE